MFQSGTWWLVWLVASGLCVQIAFEYAYCQNLELSPDQAIVETQSLQLAEEDTQRQPFHNARTWLNNMVQRSKSAVTDFLRPKRDYVNLFYRLDRWYENYEDLYDIHPEELLSPFDLLKAEFAEADRIVQEELAHKIDSTSEQDSHHDDGGRSQPSKINGMAESIDYVYIILEQMVENLESLDLDDLTSLKQELKSRPHLSDGEKFKEIQASEAFQASMKRMRKIATKTAIEKLQNEVVIFMRMFAVQMIATQLIHMSADQVNPSGLLLTLGYALANTPLIAQYIQSLYSRALMGLIKAINLPER